MKHLNCIPIIKTLLFLIIIIMWFARPSKQSWVNLHDIVQEQACERIGLDLWEDTPSKSNIDTPTCIGFVAQVVVKFCGVCKLDLIIR
jgi:hypothetical protein